MIMAKAPTQLTSEFVQEMNERAQRVGNNLVLIERGSATKEVVDELYRDMHTIKGNAQLFGYAQIGQIAHAMETCLDPIRKFSLVPKGDLVDAISDCLNVLEEILRSVEAKGAEPDLKAKISTLIPKLIEVATESFGLNSHLEKDLLLGGEDLESSVVVKPAPSPEKNSTQPKIDKEIAVTATVQTPQSTNVLEKASGETNTTLRVHVGILDRLMNLIGEMVLVRNQVLQFSDIIDDIAFLQMSQRLDLVTSELQAEVMKTRMQPIGNILEPFQRVVRDLSRELDKKIQLVLEGRETELDKTLLESIKDPLTHIIRNAADHGIETAEIRVKAGKPEMGTISVRSYHEGGQVIIEVKDDGRGLNRERIIAKAIERNLIKPEKAAQMTDRDVYNIIFLPGFSTAENVTTVSGRGVGMDVVRTNVEKIGGSVEISSSIDKGTLIRLKIPLTLAIIPALLVKCRNERFAIPQVKLVELVRVEKDQNTKIEFLQGRPMYRLRGELLPLIDLKEVLNLKDAESSAKGDVVNIVVLNADGMQFGLVVDEIQDTADIVVKPLAYFLKKLSVYSGATIMGDGSVAIILDVVGITQKENLSKRQGQEKEIKKNNLNASALHGEVQEFLLFKLAAQGKYSVPLTLIQRLEEFDRRSIEFTGEQAVVRYRDSILPLISLNSALGFPTEKDFTVDKLAVLVIQKQGRSYGVLVNEILDIETVTNDINTNVKDRPGILGNMIVQDEVIVVLDILGIIDEQAKNLGVPQANVKSEADLAKIKREKHSILLAEDANFFKKHIKSYLENAGYKVTAVPNGAEAFQLAQKSDFSAVVTDIEMPKMNGYDLAQNLRNIDMWKKRPLIAVTTRFNDQDVQRGRSVGFNAYLEKFNGDLLVAELDRLLSKDGE